ncbi:MAG TPA: hypothetical protein DCR97_04250 [Deltaproteobacteria bacterium]|nr:hypothetical protein [Deltaproteobacteria bacterium]
MSRPKKGRCCQVTPHAIYFKPRGIPLVELQEMDLEIDEVEALRLADYEGLYHEEAASRMGVSRATFGRIVGGARRKVAQAIIGGMALRIETRSHNNGEEE